MRRRRRSWWCGAAAAHLQGHCLFSSDRFFFLQWQLAPRQRNSRMITHGNLLAAGRSTATGRYRLPSCHILHPDTVTTSRRRTQLPHVTLWMPLAELQAVCCCVDPISKRHEWEGTVFATVVWLRAAVGIITCLRVCLGEPLLRCFFHLLGLHLNLLQGMKLVSGHRLLIDRNHFTIEQHGALNILRKRYVFEFSLCLSRACLGQIAFIYKWLKKTVFSP